MIRLQLRVGRQLMPVQCNNLFIVVFVQALFSRSHCLTLSWTFAPRAHSRPYPRETDTDEVVKFKMTIRLQISGS